jgi:hypothetical protein
MRLGYAVRWRILCLVHALVRVCFSEDELFDTLVITLFVDIRCLEKYQGTSMTRRKNTCCDWPYITLASGMEICKAP